MKKDIIGHLKVILELEEEECGEFIDAFIQSFDECCQDLKPQVDMPVPDYAKLRTITHTLKGFSENMGAFDLLEITNALNDAAKRMNAEDCHREIDNIFKLQQAYHDES